MVVNVVDEAGLDVECAVGREVVRCQAGEGVWEARGEGVGEVAMGHGGEGCHRLLSEEVPTEEKSMKLIAPIPVEGHLTISGHEDHGSALSSV